MREGGGTSVNLFISCYPSQDFFFFFFKCIYLAKESGQIILSNMCNRNIYFFFLRFKSKLFIVNHLNTLLTLLHFPAFFNM